MTGAILSASTEKASYRFITGLWGQSFPRLGYVIELVRYSDVHCIQNCGEGTDMISPVDLNRLIHL
jgi:hypothetical protein